MASAVLDTSPAATVAVAMSLGWALFLPTEDLVWMRQQGYISPRYVRLALLWFAESAGVRVDGVYEWEKEEHETELAPAPADRNV